MLILPWFSGVGAKVVLLCLKAKQSYTNAAPLQPLLLLLPQALGVEQNCAWMGEMVALGMPLLPSTLHFSVGLGRWGPSCGKEMSIPDRGDVTRRCHKRWGARMGLWLTSSCPVGPVVSLECVCHLQKGTICLIVLKAVFTDLLF